MTAASLTERKSVPKGESAPAVEAAIPVDNPVSKNNSRQWDAQKEAARSARPVEEARQRDRLTRKW